MNVKGDESSYLKVQILGCEVMGLLKSGATRSIMGREGYEVLKQLNLSVDHNDRVQCSTANDHWISKKKIKLTKVVVTLAMILGADFWKEMGIVPISSGSWYFSTNAGDIERVEVVCDAASGTAGYIDKGT